MPIKLENVGIAVRDLEATIVFFTDLGLIVLGRDTVSGEWTDTAVGLDGNHANIAMLETPDGNGRLELFEYIHPDAIETEPTRPNEIGMHRVAFSVDDIDEALEIAARHGCHPLRGVATLSTACRTQWEPGLMVRLSKAEMWPTRRRKRAYDISFTARPALGGVPMLGSGIPKW
jgi:glyoxylase I family protein